MQNPAPQTPQQPSTPLIVKVEGGGLLAGDAQLTAGDVAAMRARLRDLKSELQDAAERRNTVASRLRQADVAARAGYESRLQVLDNRIMVIENEITRLVQRMGSAPLSAMGAGTAFPQDPDLIASRVAGEIVPIVAILSIFVFMPIAIALSRLIWRRASGTPRQAVSDHATQQRLEQLQQSVDTIAIEVERISEGQRFVTRMMSDRAVGAGAAEPAVATKKPAIPSERR
ncbi:MAG: hypothetical protein ACRENU_00475 [Gemmatimonadaceae bacterium]